jgi:hypothetical protein
MWENEGRVNPLQKGTLNNVKVGEAELAFVKTIFKEVATVRLWELRVWMREALGVDLSEATIWRSLKQDLGLSHKKVRTISQTTLNVGQGTFRKEGYTLPCFAFTPGHLQLGSGGGVHRNAIVQGSSHFILPFVTPTAQPLYACPVWLD